MRSDCEPSALASTHGRNPIPESEFPSGIARVNKLEAFLVRLIATVIIAAAISIIMHGAQAAPPLHAGCHLARPNLGAVTGASVEVAANDSSGHSHACDPGDCCSCSAYCSAGLEPADAAADLPVPVAARREVPSAPTLSGIDPVGIKRPPRLHLA
jgi:hypothetical protein